MRACLDACVLFPTVLRELVLGVARAGLITPVWSARLLEEWARAAARRDPGDGVIAAGEIAALRAAWPEAEIAPGEERDLWLPDANDVHVLATARAGQASVIITLNLKDFPRRELAPHRIEARHPDAVLYDLWLRQPEVVEAAARAVHARAEALSGAPLSLRGLMKRARLPRLGKALADG